MILASMARLSQLSSSHPITLELDRCRLIDFYERSESLSKMHGMLRKGVLPRADEIVWPDDPFKSQFLKALSGASRVGHGSLDRACAMYTG